MSFQSKPATRQHVKPLIVLYSESGCGKTMSSLLLARGFVGPTGKIEMVDTERGRGQLYADVIPGGYNCIDFDEPFHPARFVEVIRYVESSGAQIGVMDSGSHEWEGVPGGVLDMAAEIESKSGKSLNNWRVPKMEHAKFIQALLRSKIPWIVNLRAKYKSRQTKIDGKTAVTRDEHTSPLQSEEFIFEATVHGEILPDHTFHLSKCSHPDLRKCLPNNEMMTIKHGEAVAQWCASPGGPGTLKTNGKGAQLSKLREMTEAIHGWKAGMTAADWQTLKPKLEQWLWDETILADTENLGDLDYDRLVEVIVNTQNKLASPLK